MTIRDGSDVKVSISAKMGTEGVSTAYHEAFHFLGNIAPAIRNKLQGIIRESIVKNRSYETFANRIAEGYQIPLDPSQRTKAQEAKFQEELNAYICGEIMAQNPGSEAWNLICEFIPNTDAVYSAVVDMYTDFKARQKGETKFSLKADSQGRELSEEQQKFFKDSKVRDEDGRLLVMYHGTRAENGDFTVFDYSKAVKKGGLGLKALGKGNYFTSKQLNGSERFGSRVIEAYLNVTNPFIYDGANGDTVSLAEQVQKKTGISTQGMSADALQDAMRKLGYDGIVEYRRDGSLGIAVTFDSEQIKYTTNQKPTSDPDIRYSLKNVDGYEQFRRDLQEWMKDGRPSGERFILGSTGSVLQGLGAIESDIYMNGDKISTILKEHPEMSLREIQRIPEMLEDPVLVLKSKGTGKGGNNSRMVLYSSIKAQNGQPILAVLDLRPQENGFLLDDMQKVNSSYTKDNPARFVTGSDVLYADKKRTIPLLRQFGLTITSRQLLRSGSIGSISYNGNLVNMEGVPFSSVVDFAEEEANFSLKTGTITKSYEAVLEENRLLKEQMKDYRSLKRQNQNLQESRDYWKGQTKPTKEVTTDRRAVGKAAAELLKSYSSEADVSDIQDRLQNLYDSIARGDEGVSYEEAWKRAEAIAEAVIDKAVAKESPGDSYQELLDYLKTTKIVVGKKDQGGISKINGFKARQEGRLNLSIQGKTNIDQVYQELSERWPEFFDETEHTNPSDQLLQIADVADQLRQVEEYNPFEGDGMDQVVAGAANEILERFFDLPQTKKTFADRQEAKLNAAKAQGKQQVQKVREGYKERLDKLQQANRQRVADTIDRERGRADQKIQKLKDKYAARDAAGREKREIREYKSKIRKTARELSRRLLNPTDSRHIPESLRGPVAAFLSSIDFSGKKQDTKAAAVWQDLRNRWEAVAKGQNQDTFSGEYLTIDPELVPRLDELLEADVPSRLEALSREEAEELWKVTAAIKAAVTAANRSVIEGKKVTAAEAGKDLILELSMRKARNPNQSSLSKNFADFFQYGMTDSTRFGEMFGPTMESLIGNLREGHDVMVRKWNEAVQYAESLFGKEKVWEWGGEYANPQSFRLTSGETLSLTPAQVMSLYLLNKREQGRRHLYKGGVESAETRGKHKRFGQGSRTAVTEGDVAQIINSLTPQQKRVADGLGYFLSHQAAEWGNEASMERFGYRKFTEENYFPIKADRNYTRSSVESGDRPGTIAGLGMTKSVNKAANNPVLLEDVFDVFSRHVTEMAAYNAFYNRLEDFQSVWNWQDNRFHSVKDSLRTAGGDGANQYIRNLLTAVNGRATVERSLSETLLSKYKAGVIGGNLRVVIQQPTAYTRALTLIDGKYLLRGLAGKVDTDIMKTYAPIALWKDWGYYETGNGKQVKDLILGRHKAGDRFSEAMMALPGIMDNLTWGRLWKACEYEIADTTDLKPKTDEFYRAVGKRFTEVIDKTQVVDSVFHRSQIMRSKNFGNQLATAFMAEPTKSYNAIMGAIRSLQNASGAEGRKAAVRGVGRAVSAYVVTNVINALVVSLMDAARDDDRDKDYAEKYREALLGEYSKDKSLWDNIRAGLSANLTENLNPMALIPYLKDVMNLAEGYDIKRMDMQGISELVSSVKKWESLGNGKYTVAYLMKDTAESLSKLTGIPIGNLMRELSTLTNTGISVADSFGADTVELRYRLSKTMYDVKNSQNLGLFTGLVWEARQNGNEELARTIYNDLIRSGWSNEKLDQRLQTLAKKALDGSDLVSQYLDAEEKGSASGMERAAAAAGDRGFSGQEFQAAVNQERNRRKKGSEEAAAGQEIQDGYWAGGETEYSYGNLYQAVLNGDSASVSSIRKALEASGKSEKDIDSAVKSRIRADLKDAFWESGSLGNSDVRKFLRLLSEWDSGTDGKDYLEKATWKKWKETYQGGKGEYSEYRKYYDILKKVFGYSNDEIIRMGKDK